MKADAWALAPCIDWAGQHALALYFGMLALSLAATSVGRLAWPRSAALRWQAGAASTPCITSIEFARW